MCSVSNLVLSCIRLRCTGLLLPVLIIVPQKTVGTVIIIELKSEIEHYNHSEFMFFKKSSYYDCLLFMNHSNFSLIFRGASRGVKMVFVDQIQSVMCPGHIFIEKRMMSLSSGMPGSHDVFCLFYGFQSK